MQVYSLLLDRTKDMLCGTIVIHDPGICLSVCISSVDIQGVQGVYTPSVRKIRDIRHCRKQIFLAQNAPKSFVAKLRPDPLEELTALLQTP